MASKRKAQKPKPSKAISVHLDYLVEGNSPVETPFVRVQVEDSYLTAAAAFKLASRILHCAGICDAVERLGDGSGGMGGDEDE